MGVWCTSKGPKIGRKTKSILPDYEIRYRKQGGKPWYIFEKGEGKMVYSSSKKEDCDQWLASNNDLCGLVASHPWGRV